MNHFLSTANQWISNFPMDAANYEASQFATKGGPKWIPPRAETRWSPRKCRHQNDFVSLGSGSKCRALCFLSLWPFACTRRGECVFFQRMKRARDRHPPTKARNAHGMAIWIHHLLTKVQQMKLMRSSLKLGAWLEKEWHWASVAPCSGLTCAGWCQRSFHASRAQKSSCITWMQSWHLIKPWESKGLLEDLWCCPAPTCQLICTQHGVMPVISKVVRESLH